MYIFLEIYDANENREVGATPTQFHTNDNKFQVTVRSLELIYTRTDWPPGGARFLSKSLKNSGKSRADLWQFAGNIGLERAIGNTNKNGQNFREHNAETNLCAQIGQENCIMTLKKPIPFRFLQYPNFLFFTFEF